MKDSIVLVTGGAGYCGIPTVEELLNRGISVRIFDKLLWGEKPIFNLLSRVDVVQGDIRNVDPSVLKGVTAVIHFAGLSNDPTAEYNPEANTEINTIGTKKLAELCKSKGIRKFTFASSASVYDRGLLAEDFLQDEKSKLEPRAAYAISKFHAEEELLKLKSKDFAPVILRQGTVYGFSPRMRYDLVVNSFVKDALMNKKITVFCGGEQWRPLVDISDIALAHIACIEAPQEKVSGEIFNVVYKNYRILELAHWVRKVFREKLNIDIEIEVDYSEKKDRSYRISNDKITKAIGFAPKVSVEDSVINMIDRIQEYGYKDFLNPKYFNIKWMELLTEMEDTVKKIGKVF